MAHGSYRHVHSAAFDNNIPCRGLEAVSAAQDRLHSGHSVGKIVVQLAADVPPSIAASARL